MTFSRGGVLAVDSGSSTSRGDESCSTSLEFTSRKNTRIVKISISETRLSATTCLRRAWCRFILAARFLKRIAIPLRLPLRRGERRVADRDLGEQLDLDRAPRVLVVTLARAHAIHHRHDQLVRNLRLEQQRRIELVRETALHVDEELRERVEIVLAVLRLEPPEHAGVAVADLDHRLANRDLEREGRLFRRRLPFAARNGQ